MFIIETKNLTKKFAYPENLNIFRKQGFTLAVNNVNLQVKEGELFGLVGLNGAGKTTLIKMLCCLITPTKGTARISGCDIIKDEEKIKACIGLVNSDERSFYGRLTGRQNLHFFANLYGLFSQPAEEKIKELLELLEIEYPDNQFQGYSTGTKQRLAIARSILNDPKILFMDEPTKSLDPVSAQCLRKFVKEELAHRKGKTIFFATHNLIEAEYLADRIAVMEKAQIKACGETKIVLGEMAKYLQKQREL